LDFLENAVGSLQWVNKSLLLSQGKSNGSRYRDLFIPDKPRNVVWRRRSLEEEKVVQFSEETEDQKRMLLE
jgi:hypothetical protein